MQPNSTFNKAFEKHTVIFHLFVILQLQWLMKHDSPHTSLTLHCMAHSLALTMYNYLAGHEINE